MLMGSVLYLADHESPLFEARRISIDVVCAGDSITGWNNFGGVREWPSPTYPDFLQHLCEPSLFTPSGLCVANGGIAGEVSQNGVGQVQDYLAVFPNARYFVVGFGTNDLGIWPEVETTSLRIVEYHDRMVRAIRDSRRKPVLLNVPNANESLFPRPVAEDFHRKRDYHNRRLSEYCHQNQVPLVDICSKLRDEHFADELHPNEKGAQIIAEAVFQELTKMRREEHTR
jgi:lysophospholipase L1-like esterase